MSREIGVLVGTLLKRARTERNLTLRALAERSNVSASMISQIETGEKSPTITVLSALAAGLGVPLSRLVEEPPTDAKLRVLRAAETAEIVDPSGIRRATLAPPASGSELEFVRLRFPEDAIVVFAAHPDGTYERVVVHEGTVTLTLADETTTLGPGDSAIFDGAFAHRFAATTDALVYLVVEPGD